MVGLYAGMGADPTLLVKKMDVPAAGVADSRTCAAERHRSLKLTGQAAVGCLRIRQVGRTSAAHLICADACCDRHRTRLCGRLQAYQPCTLVAILPVSGHALDEPLLSIITVCSSAWLVASHQRRQKAHRWSLRHKWQGQGAICGLGANDDIVTGGAARQARQRCGGHRFRCDIHPLLGLHAIKQSQHPTAAGLARLPVQQQHSSRKMLQSEVAAPDLLQHQHATQTP